MIRWLRDWKMARVMRSLDLPDFYRPDDLLREFERVNGVPFDPYCDTHVSVARMAVVHAKLKYVASMFDRPPYGARR